MDNDSNHPDDSFLSPEDETEIEARAILGHAEMTMDQLLEQYEQLSELQRTCPQDVPPGALAALNQKLQEQVEWMRPYGLVPEGKDPGTH